MLCRILFVRTEGIRAWVFEQGSELQQGVPRRRKRKFEPFALGSRTHLVFQLAVCFWVLGLPLGTTGNSTPFFLYKTPGYIQY